MQLVDLFGFFRFCHFIFLIAILFYINQYKQRLILFSIIIENLVATIFSCQSFCAVVE